MTLWAAGAPRSPSPRCTFHLEVVKRALIDRPQDPPRHKPTLLSLFSKQQRFPLDVYDSAAFKTPCPGKESETWEGNEATLSIVGTRASTLCFSRPL